MEPNPNTETPVPEPAATPEEPVRAEAAVPETIEGEERARLSSALRELQAAKARVERDARSLLEETRIELVARLLPVLDNFDRAIAAAEADGNAPAVVEGARMVRRQLEGVLAGYGLQRFDAVGAPFDPTRHDATAVIEVADEAQDRRVIEQIESGYLVGERLLRAARVIVGKHVPRTS